VVGDESDGYPMLAAFDRSELVTQALYDYAERTGEQPTSEQVHSFLASQEQAIMDDLSKALRTPAGIEAIRKDDELKSALIAALTGETGEGGEGVEDEETTEEPIIRPAGDRRLGRHRRGNGAPAKPITNDVVAQPGTRSEGGAKPFQHPRSNRARAIAEMRKRLQQNQESGVREGAFD
jgi:hypothetical protein